MASSHKLKDPNGDPLLSPQDKSIDLKLPNQVVDGRDVKMQQHLPQEQPKTNTDSDHLVTHVHQGITHIPKVEHNKVPAAGALVGNVIKYDFDDVLIIPKSQTYLNSRYNDVNPYYKNEITTGSFLPLMTAPMDSVVDHHNAVLFQKNKINVVLPRTVNKKGVLASAFNSYGLKDNPINPEMCPLILLDVANGHMSSVMDWCIRLKKEYPNIKIMAGNIANPQTYYGYCSSGVIDYARIGIGNGNGCLTTQQTGVGYPMASLIAECYQIKIRHKNPIKIVADGGMKDYADIIKALALGADYVMIGSIFSKALESSAPNYWGFLPIGKNLAETMYKSGFKIRKEFRGMSTKQAQKALGNTNIKTSEGVVRKYNIEYTLEQWVSNFEHYLRSSMSYNNAPNLSNFIGKGDYTIISNNALNRFKK